MSTEYQDAPRFLVSLRSGSDSLADALVFDNVQTLFPGFVRLHVGMSIDSFCHEWELVYAPPLPRRGDPSARPAKPGDLIAIKYAVGDKPAKQPFLVGYVDTMEEELEPDGLVITLSGRSLTCDLVDCSGVRESDFDNTKEPLPVAWKAASPIDIIDDLTAPYRLPGRHYLMNVVLGSTRGKPLPKPPGESGEVFKVHYGETYADTIRRLCERYGLMAYNRGTDLIIGSVGEEQTTTALTEGSNIRSVRKIQGYSRRFNTYYGLGEKPTSDGDTIVIRSKPHVDSVYGYGRHRPYLIQVGALSKAHLDRYILQQRNYQAGDSEAVRVSVDSPTMAEASPLYGCWRPNITVKTSLPTFGFDAVMVVSSVEYDVTADSVETRLTLRLPETYTTEAYPIVNQSNDNPFFGITSWDEYDRRVR